MRVLIATAGARGDVAPLTGLATAIRAAGHGVTIASNDEYEGLVRRGRRSHSVTFFRQNIFERSADLCLIVDHEDMVHERASETGTLAAPDSTTA